MVDKGLNKVTSKFGNFKYLCSLTVFAIALNSCLESNNFSNDNKNKKQDTSVVVGKTEENKIDNIVSFDEIKVLIETGDYSKAIDDLLKIRDDLLLQNNSVENKQELWQIYASLGMCYSEMQEFDKSLEIYDKAYKLAQELNNKERQIRNINDIAVIYLDYIEDKKPCLDYFQKGLDLIDGLDQKSFESYQHSIYLIYVNLSNYYVDAKDINSAKKYFNKANEIVDKNLSVVDNEALIRQRKISKFALMTIESDFLIAESKYQEAIDNYLKAFEIVKELDHKAYQEWIYNSISDLYKDKFGNYKKAYEFKEKAIDVREKRISSDSQKAIKDSEVKYKTKEIELEKEKTEAQLEAQKQRNRFALLGVVTALLTALGASGFGYVVKKKNKALHQANQEITEQKAVVVEQKAVVDQKNQELEKANQEITEQKCVVEQKNQELEKANQEITEQKAVVDQKNQELEKANQEIMEQKCVVEQKNQDLEKANKEIMAQKAELDTAYEELRATNENLTETNDKLEKANNDINSSINYASKIQASILYNDIQEHFPKSFVFYKPKDVVSGDFYFSAENSQGKKIIAVADCTGHGVPGALLTILGKTDIQQIFDKVDGPNKILDHLDVQFIDLQKKSKLKDNMMHDSMDIACVFYDTETKILNFSSAFRPMFIFRKNGDIEKIEATTRAELGSQTKKDFDGYKNLEIQLYSGDEVFLFTDGLSDQFDKYDRKLKLVGFRDILSLTATIPMAERTSYIQKMYENMMKKPNGELVPQTDDICLVGFRVE